MQVPEWASGLGLLGLGGLVAVKGLLEIPPELYEEAGAISLTVAMILIVAWVSVVSGSNRYK